MCTGQRLLNHIIEYSSSMVEGYRSLVVKSHAFMNKSRTVIMHGTNLRVMTHCQMIKEVSTRQLWYLRPDDYFALSQPKSSYMT